MAVAAGAARPRGRSLGRFFMGPRIGTTMIVLGLLLATAAAVLVVSLGRRTRATAAETVAEARNVQVAYVVVAVRDLPENTRIPAEAVTVKPFPAAYAPAGAAAAPEEVVGKFTATRLVRDQIVLTSQVATTRRAANLAAAVPPGKMAFWMTVPDLLAQTGGLRPGDRVDVLLSLAVPAPAASPPNAGGAPAQLTAAVAAPAAAAGAAGGAGQAIQTTQLTLQNVEVFFVGTVGAENPASAAGQAPPSQASQSGPAPAGTRVTVVLLDPQDALVAKFIRDAGGTIDLALRSPDWPDTVSTDPVTIDSLADRFGFRTRPAASTPAGTPAGGGR